MLIVGLGDMLSKQWVGCRLDLGCELVDIAKVWDNVEKGAESGRVVCVCVCVYT